VVAESSGLWAARSHLLVANTPGNVQDPALNTYRTLGAVELATGDLNSAQQWLRRRLETAPRDALARFYLGTTYLRLGDTQAAIEQWETAGAQQQLVKLGETQMEQGALTEALTALEASMRLAPVDVNARWLAAEAWRREGNAERALQLYQDIIAIEPESIWPRQLAAEIWIEQGNSERGLALYQEMITVAPERPDGYALTGVLLFDDGQYEQAIVLFEQALARNPVSPRWIMMRLGRAHAALGHWGEAARVYEQAIRADPTHQEDYTLMGDAQCRLGRADKARTYYEEALALGSPSGSVQQAIEFIERHGYCPEF
jgi:tetratricopeptide (TPR) repeat protein